MTLNECIVENITAINPQDRQATGFSVWGAMISLNQCTAKNVSVGDLMSDQERLVGLGIGFGWAPDPRLYHTAVTSVTYRHCHAQNAQVGFDTWNHIDSHWISPSYSNCAIDILVEPKGVRTVYGDPCTECTPPVKVQILNQAKGNQFPGVPEDPISPISMQYAYPSGNINSLNIPSALGKIGANNTQWWFYVGLLTVSYTHLTLPTTSRV